MFCSAHLTGNFPHFCFPGVYNNCSGLCGAQETQVSVVDAKVNQASETSPVCCLKWSATT